MGCVLPRSDITAEEATSHNMDLLLGYTQIKVERFYKVLSKLANDGKVSCEGFMRLKEKLALQGKNPDFVQQINNFYERVKVDIGNYSVKRLTGLAVLLCKGSDEEKAAVFYKGIVGEGVKCTEEGIREAFDELFEVCLLVLTGMQIKDEINNLSAEDMRRFAFKLRKGKEGAIDLICTRLFSEDSELTENSFIRKVRDRLPEGLFTGDGARKLLKDKATKC